MKKLFFIIFCISYLTSFSQTGINTRWAWISGDSTIDQLGVYGTQGVPSVLNKPRSRNYAISWTDAAGNFWLFGGSSGPGFLILNDLWKYNPNSNEWTWVSGSSVGNQQGIYGIQGIAAVSNVPGSRYGGTSWIDDNGNLWLFGGNAYVETGSGPANDLWKFDPINNQWTWMKGSKIYYPPSVYGTQGLSSVSNTPGGRTASTAWKDLSGNFWLFGGLGVGNFSNDLWKFDPINNQWTWIKGDNTGNHKGIYGIQTVADILNKPGSRLGGCSWTDNSGDLWMFGGYGYSINNTTAEEISDLWKYNLATNKWAWMKGDTISWQLDVYGTQGIPDALNKPGARDDVAAWKDANGDLWMFAGLGGGVGTNFYNDLWKYDIATNNWTWVKGDNTFNHNGIYGTIAVPGISNKPGGRVGPVFWTDNLKNFWMFGGMGYAQSGTYGKLNDLWKINSNELIPLTLLSFSGSIKGNENLLYWQTANEINTSHFNIERSADGRNFIAIGNVFAVGSSSAEKKYSFTDKQPLSGINFYKLKMLDIDGRFTYSNTIALKRNENESGILLFPNPVKDILFVQVKGEKGNGVVEVIDATGKIIKESNIQMNENTSFSINVSTLVTGHYELLIKTSSKNILRKFIKE